MKYNPSLLQLTIYSARSHLDMALAIKAIPRLTHTFKINNTHLMSYSYAIAHDKICCNLQLSLDKSILKIKYFLFFIIIQLRSISKFSIILVICIGVIL